MVDSTRSERRFVPFFRRYTKTWIHAVATAGLTAFGTLTFVNRAFAVVALGIYVLPPVVLFLRGANPGERGSNATKTAVTEADLRGDSGTSPRDRSDATGGSNAESETVDDAKSESDGDAPTRSWTVAETPTDGTLFDTVVAEGAAYAVGENGVVLRSEGDEDDRNDWRIALEDGPGANAADLRGVDATTDGRAVWVAGDGGALGRFDVAGGRHTDHSAPADVTDNWTAVAVGGTTDDETVLLANGSGQVLRGRYRDGDLAWDTPVKPGSGSSLCAATMVGASVGVLCDTNDGVFETDDGGETFGRIGIDGVDGTLTDVTATGGGRRYVTTDDGICYRGDDGTWTPTRLGDEGIRAVSAADGAVAACGETGVVYERADGEWDRTLTPANGTLHGIAVAPSRSVAVGAGGTVVERRTDATT
ncbi:hypothetical protein [Haladaptatus sp. T7]|uniref:WD40/YVTN/BNR-like repeat-containing protein n=1 Tax=Haladaptatus sp. T7 TaxID=2029368 RepID=UPI0021A2584F|nr:hypothetical protein [Haladaptatus sp. T7]GKZ15529.1 hypothetical protein HAL_34100 [Haladaptatus sp. T7]